MWSTMVPVVRPDGDAGYDFQTSACSSTKSLVAFICTHNVCKAALKLYRLTTLRYESLGLYYSLPSIHFILCTSPLSECSQHSGSWKITHSIAGPHGLCSSHLGLIMSLFNSLFLLCFSAFGYLSRGLDLLHSCIYSPCSCLFHLTPPLHEYPGSNQSKIHFALVHAGGSPQWTSNRHYECKTGQHCTWPIQHLRRPPISNLSPYFENPLSAVHRLI